MPDAGGKFKGISLSGAKFWPGHRDYVPQHDAFARGAVRDYLRLTNGFAEEDLERERRTLVNCEQD
jgi:hypothetical protein